jgi:nitrogen fixation protein NifQ
MSSAVAASMTPQDVYDRLMAARRGDPVEDTLARILASWTLGDGAMPRWLGLGRERFEEMMQAHFPGLPSDALSEVEATLDVERQLEMADLQKLLLQHRTDPHSDAQALMADIVVVGCMGNDHLWQDLGLWCRADLSKLMNDNFAPLAARNDRDMKWKKFLYKQLCETEGIYTCRSPSCEVCVDYTVCFGPEE